VILLCVQRAFYLSNHRDTAELSTQCYNGVKLDRNDAADVVPVWQQQQQQSDQDNAPQTAAHRYFQYDCLLFE